MENKIDKVLKKYINEDGRIVSYPSKRNRLVRPFIYEYLITKFDNKKEYKEPEINKIIKEWICFEDYLIIRREMVEQGLLNRLKDCSKYWVNRNYKSICGSENDYE